MSFPRRALALAVAGGLAAAVSLHAQTAKSSSGEVAKMRENRFRWYLGAGAGAMIFSTPGQTRTGIPAVGAHFEVVSRRAGLMVGVEEGFGSDESSAFLDSSSGGQVRPVTFDHLRRYGASLTGYPVRGMLEPYLGVGFGLIQVMSPELGGSFASAEEVSASQAEAKDRSASGFVSFLAGVQFKVGRLSAFGQYQIGSSPSPGNLLVGSSHTIMGGLRFSLGSAKEDVKGGGY